MAQVIPWRGATARMLFVHKHGLGNARSFSQALAMANDAAPDNRYVIVGARDRFTEWIVHGRSYVDVIGEDQYHTIVERPKADLSGVPFKLGGSSGGTITICGANAENPLLRGFVPAQLTYGLDPVVRDVMVGHLHVIRNQSGASGAGNGGPPEAAVYVGGEETYPGSSILDANKGDEEATAPQFQDVLLRQLVADGIHDTVQVFGVGSGVSEIPRFKMVDCHLRGTHDVSTYKGHLDVLHLSNLLELITQPTVYLTDIRDWKCTCIHHNKQRASDPGALAQFSGYHPFGSRIRSIGDTMIMENGLNVDDVSAQAQMAAVLIYWSGGLTQNVSPPEVLIRGADIRGRWTVDYVDPEYGMSGMHWKTQADTVNGFDVEQRLPFEVEGCTIDLDCTLDAPGTPSDVSCIRMQDESLTPPAKTMQVKGCMLSAKTAKTGGAAHAILCEGADQVVEVFDTRAAAGAVTERDGGSVTPGSYAT